MESDSPIKSGMQAVQSSYESWTSALAQRSVATCYAIIAASWALHGECSLERPLVEAAVTIAVAYMGLSLGVMLWMAHQHYFRHRFAEECPRGWAEEFDKKEKDPSRYRFPYTLAIDRVGIIYAWLKVVLPAASAALFIYSIFHYGPCKQAPSITSSACHEEMR